MANELVDSTCVFASDLIGDLLDEPGLVMNVDQDKVGALPVGVG